MKMEDYNMSYLNRHKGVEHKKIEKQLIKLINLQKNYRNSHYVYYFYQTNWK